MSYYTDMAARLINASSAAEGSFAMDNIAAVAVELERLGAQIAAMPDRFFPNRSKGADLTLAAANFGVDRKSAIAASALLTLTGTPGADYTDVKCCAGALVFAVQGAGVLNAQGSAQVTAVCETAGAVGNVPAGSIGEFAAAYAGLESVSNAAGTGGMDEESDADLLLRLEARWKNPSTGGNLGDYKRWALDIDGVSRVRVFNPAAGSVNVLLVGTGNTTPPPSVVSAVQSAIDAVRPVGASVTVSAAQAVPIALSATVVLSAGAQTEAVRTSIAKRFADYLESVSFTSGTVSYVRTAELLFAQGVEDVISYSLNGAPSSISLTDGQFPTAGAVTVMV